MPKRDPDDLISAISKNFKKQKPQIMRITLKRGGLHFAEKAKAHSRAAKKGLRERVRLYSNEHEGQISTLYARYKENQQPKEEDQQIANQPLRLNSAVKLGKGNDFISSLMGVFRVNFFKNKQQNKEKPKAQPTKKNPNSKSSLKKIVKNKKNQERRQKRQEIHINKKKQIRKVSLQEKNNTKIPEEQ